MRYTIIILLVLVLASTSLLAYDHDTDKIPASTHATIVSKTWHYDGIAIQCYKTGIAWSNIYNLNTLVNSHCVFRG